MSDAVFVERRDPVAIVTMNAPKTRNALNLGLVEGLVDAVGKLQEQPEIRAIVLSGGAHFCAGGDLSLLDNPPLAMRRIMHAGQRVIRMLTAGPLPIVAAVQGTAYGAGFSMALACDFIVAEASSAFCAAFGRVGLTPDYGLLWSLPRRVGIGVAREMVMLCEPISGTKAHFLGLVDRIAEPGKVLETATQLADQLAKSPPGTIATTKSVLARQPLPLDAMLAWEADSQALLTRTDDFAEGIEAFRQKRPPAFRGT